MLLHIANYEEADRRTAIADEALGQGNVVAITGLAGSNGVRRLNKVTASGQLLAGVWGVVMKVSDNALAVTSSDLTGVPSDVGSNLVTIVSGDAVVVARKGAIMEYDPSLLDASLTAANAIPGEALGIVSGKWSKAAAGGAIATPVAGRVYDVAKGKVRIELVL